VEFPAAVFARAFRPSAGESQGPGHAVLRRATGRAGSTWAKAPRQAKGNDGVTAILDEAGGEAGLVRRSGNGAFDAGWLSGIGAFSE
jgi:hypothetical protein